MVLFAFAARLKSSVLVKRRSVSAFVAAVVTGDRRLRTVQPIWANPASCSSCSSHSSSLTMLPALSALLLLAAGSQAVKLDAATHSELLLQGRPQVGLWKALSAEAEMMTSWVSQLDINH